ncbi:MAG: hypothetical protein IJL98_02110 [Lachnospiraceae bacterium]|nr:hypothetical protein [Lachnospiraceae bacterium]
MSLVTAYAAKKLSPKVTYDEMPHPALRATFPMGEGLGIRLPLWGSCHRR